MKTLAYYPLHYGIEYLEASLKSIVNHVDKIIILYSEKPSFGHGTHIKNPEKERDLKAITDKYGCEWIRTRADFEGMHRDQALEHAKGFDLLLAVDADEVWSEDLGRCLKEAYKGKSKYYGIDGFVNFWRSFEWACYDGFTPIRITNLNVTNKQQSVLKGKIYHFSCAQREEIMRYKYEVHGHKSEIKQGWLEDVYFQNKKIDVHPVSIGLWVAQPFNKEELPDILKDHPNYNKELI